MIQFGGEGMAIRGGWVHIYTTVPWLLTQHLKKSQGKSLFRKGKKSGKYQWNSVLDFCGDPDRFLYIYFNECDFLFSS